MESRQRQVRCICLLCGLPAAGKSSIAALLVKSDESATLLLDYDEMYERQKPVLEHGDAFDVAAWRASRKAAFERVELALKSPTGSPSLVVVDDNLYYSSMRNQFYQLARRHKTAYLVVHLVVSSATALRRNSARLGSARVPDPIIQRMSERFEPPEKIEWEREHTLVLNSEELPAEECAERILKAISAQKMVPPLDEYEAKLKAVEDEKAKQRTANLNSLLHQLDLSLRKEISAVLQKHPERAGAVAQAKKQFLDSVKRELSQSSPSTSSDSMPQLLDELTGRFRTLIDQKKNETLT